MSLGTQYQMQSISSKVSFEWESIEWSDGTEYHYGSSVSNRMREKYKGMPAVYRWVALSKQGDPTHVYIGETADMIERLNAYLNPTKAKGTDVRVAKVLGSLAKQRATVRLERLKLTDAIIGAHKFDDRDLRWKYVRLLLENLALFQFARATEHESCEILNTAAEDFEKLKTVSRDEVSRILDTSPAIVRKSILVDIKAEYLKGKQV